MHYTNHCLWFALGIIAGDAIGSESNYIIGAFFLFVAFLEIRGYIMTKAQQGSLG